MRYAPLLSALGCAFLHASHAFEFTGPDSSEKLDLTKPITITWDANNGPFIEPKARALDLWFSVIKSINDTGALISPATAHTFETRLMNNSGSQLSAVESDKYAVEGFDFIRNSAGKGAQAGFYTAAVAFTVTGLVLL
ncbi:hypothetical protein FAGAP_4869 [Fusarium agapanthi]|uniref:Uncharacterized protein n=1 Tax=Fusarium agapanthi TaxID=1803897 RepID=A0A9P5BB65_9HYPO|nr:hypothetical protein FAGAP_4869 [Fusarium agapanthi]